jgi:uncharacterized RDD family membrane protein YckC
MRSRLSIIGNSMVETAATEKRILAFVVDRVIEAIIYLPIWIQLAASYLSEGEYSVSIRMIVACLLMHLLYDWMFLYFLGGTIGKLLFGLRVVPRREPYETLTLMQSLLRPLTDRLAIFFGQSLRALAFIRFDRTHVSDWVAETWVVQGVPRRRKPVRRFFLVIFIILFSLSSSFLQFYRLVQSAHIEENRVIFDVSDMPDVQNSEAL